MEEYIEILLLYPTWIKAILIVFVVTLFIQLFYYLHYYNGIIRYNRKIKKNLINYTSSKPAVSIIVCANNEVENLSMNLPKLLEQNYPSYEVIVVNDGSTEESCNLLKQLVKKYPNLHHTFLPREAKYTNRKKMCLNIGIKAAHNEQLIIVDADCEPESNAWLSYIMRNYTSEVDLVLGFSDFREKKGFLNKLIGYENLLSTMQFMGFALKGRVIKGNGHNISYKKSIVVKNKAVSSHLRLEYGDDDLLVQEISTAKNVRIEFSPDSVIHANRKISFKNYLYDKEKKLMTQEQYKKSLKALLYIDKISNLAYKIILIGLLSYSLVSTDRLLLLITFSIFFIKATTHSIVVNKTAKILREKNFYLTSLLIEFIKPFISLYVLIKKSMSKNKKNTWK